MIIITIIIFFFIQKVLAFLSMLSWITGMIKVIHTFEIKSAILSRRRKCSY